MANIADKQPSQLRAFISYSRKDSRFVDRLDADLNTRNIQAWVDRRIQAGDDWLQEIQVSIERCDVFLLVLSPDMLDSRWVRMEYMHALTLNKPIIPLLLHPVEKVPMAINTIQWVRFEHDYDAGLNDLLIILGNHVGKPRSTSMPTTTPNRPQVARQYSNSNLIKWYSPSKLLNQPLFLAWRLMWWLSFNPLKAVDYFRQFADGGMCYYKTFTVMLVMMLSVSWFIPLSTASFGFVPLSEAGVSNGFVPLHWLIVGSGICAMTLLICRALIHVKTDIRDVYAIAFSVAVSVSVIVTSAVAGGVSIGVVGGVAIGMSVGVAVGVAIGMSVGVMENVKESESGCVGVFILLGMVFGMALCLALILAGFGVVALAVAVVGCVAIGVACLMVLVVWTVFEGFINKISDSIVGKISEEIRLHFGVMLSFVALWITYLALIWIYWLGGWQRLTT